MDRTDRKRGEFVEILNRLDILRDITTQKFGIALAVLIAGFIFTLFASLFVKNEIETAAKNEFKFICNEIRLNIADRLDASALILFSGAALFDASETVSRAEWRNFVHALRIDQQIPGTQGIGYALLIPPDQLEAHIQQVRGQGFPDYTVHPEGDREIYSSIIYLEPFTDRNLRAFGYDMFSETVRRSAMMRARDENVAALTSKVTLVQETDQDVQAGTLMYVPVYRHGAPTATVAERRAAIQGWVYSPYRMKDLMHGTLGNYQFRQGDWHIVLQIYDGTAISPETLLYDSRFDESSIDGFSPADISQTILVNSYGELWTLKFTQLGGLPLISDYGSLWLVLIGGSSISLLLFVLTISQFRTAHYLESIRMLADADALTGVYNRRKIMELAESEFLRAKRQHHELTILMIDLNFFKHINDNFSHVVGDQALRLTAKAMQNTLRNGVDRVGRFGGDEFLIILPEICLTDVRQISERLRASVAASTWNIAKGLDPVSLSIGAAGLDSTTRSIDHIIEQADRAMYADKKRIRDIAENL